MDFDPNCLFCKIVAGQIPSTIVYQDQDIVAFDDIHPQAKQHVLIVPRRHIPSAAAITIEDGSLLAQLFIAAQKIARDLNIDQTGYRLVTNIGPHSGQAVFHLHFHLLGGEQLGLFGRPHTH
jgi:histidine triad (HIT) family protein